MLGKLFKYDMKALARAFLPLYAALLIVSLVNKILIALGFNVAIFIGGSVFGMMVGGVCVASFILTLLRFRKSLLGNEGYLTFTLPVSPDKIILSKLFSAAVWFIASFIVVFLSIVIVSASGTDYLNFFGAIPQMFARLSEMGFSDVILSIDAIVITLLLMLTSIMFLYCCISLSMLVNRHRKAFSFGAFVVITIIGQIIGAIIIEALIRNAPVSTPELANVHIIMGLVILGELVVFGIFYSVTRYMLTKKLNLE